VKAVGESRLSIERSKIEGSTTYQNSARVHIRILFQVQFDGGLIFGSSHIDNCIAATIYTQDIVVKKESKISKKFKE